MQRALGLLLADGATTGVALILVHIGYIQYILGTYLFHTWYTYVIINILGSFWICATASCASSSTFPHTLGCLQSNPTRGISRVTETNVNIIIIIIIETILSNVNTIVIFFFKFFFKRLFKKMPIPMLVVHYPIFQIKSRAVLITSIFQEYFQTTVSGQDTRNFINYGDLGLPPKAFHFSCKWKTRDVRDEPSIDFFSPFATVHLFSLPELYSLPLLLDIKLTLSKRQSDCAYFFN